MLLLRAFIASIRGMNIDFFKEGCPMYGNLRFFDEVDEIFESFFGGGRKNQNRGGYGQGSNKRYYYTCPSFPPTDVTADKESSNLSFEMALAGIPKENIDISFVDNYMILNVKNEEDKNERIFLHRGIKRNFDISSKYFVPESVYNTKEAKASFVDGILKVFIPSREKIKKEKKKLAIE